MKKTTGQRMRETLDRRAEKRPQFEHLKGQVKELMQKVDYAERRASYATSEAEKRCFEKYARMHPELSHVMERIVREMGRGLAENLRPHAEKMASACRFEMTVSSRMEDKMEVVWAEIPAIRFSYLINPRNWR